MATTKPTSSPRGAPPAAAPPPVPADAIRTRPPQQNFLEGRHNYDTITEVIGKVVLSPRPPIQWILITFLAFGLVNVLLMTITWLVLNGIGIWGNNQPVGWGFDIINFVWWIGIGHAGTLISAILLLMQQSWRNSINRFAEAMTIFAVICAGLFPLLHTGRPWVAYWMFPYPNIMGMWPQFRSPLMWDVFAVSTYALVSIIFWFIGLIPDLATLRDRAKWPVAKALYGIAGMGWTGSAKHWFRYEQAYNVLAGLSAPLVLSVHTIVSFDFAVGIVPGWHTTIFPPYFVAGAVFAGFAMVMTFGIPLRKLYGLKDFITDTHLDWMAKITLATGLIVFYGYILELFYGWYSGNVYELAVVNNRLFGPYAWAYYALLFCNGFMPQIFWSRKARYNTFWLLTVSMAVNVGMWLERFVIIPVSLHRDYLPSSWGMYSPTVFDWSMFIGTMGLFTFLMFLFIKFLPMINIFEMKELLYRYTHRPRNGHQVEDGSAITVEAQRPAEVGAAAKGAH
ncbi:MAG TPA: NrfD/PsrC family molybdoenzyme membrane anchor subunit [Armatimonadaceae bacterium]|nr:NrfD/PsrC family molybdoenzyme membrane anchor subunit [Armatimonadaceae bacterium]